MVETEKIGYSMEPVSQVVIIEFLKRLGEQFPSTASFYLLGGSALSFLGSSRETLDIDYTTDLNLEDREKIENLIHQLAFQLKLDVESVLIEEFIPLPPEAMSRRRFIGHYGNMDVYVFDLYSISLSKISRGFEADIEDVLFLLKQKLIDIDMLEYYFEIILPDAPKLDIDRNEFSKYFKELKSRWLLNH
jgi:hypothetical protein